MPPVDPSTLPATSVRKLKHHASDTQLSRTSSNHQNGIDSQDGQNHPSTQPPLVRKRSKLFQIRRPKPANGTARDLQSRTSHEKLSFDSSSPYLAGVMASKDPASELRRLAGTRSQMSQDDERMSGSFSQDAISSPTFVQAEDAPSPGVDSIKSLFGDSAKSRTLAFLSRKQKSRKSLFPLLADRAKSSTAPPTAAPSPRPSTSFLSSSDIPTQATWPRLGHSSAYQSNEHSPSGNGSSQSISGAHHSVMGRSSSVISDRSTRSSPQLADPKLGRKRSSTGDSGSGRSEETAPTPPFVGGSGRNSTSTAGRSSFSNLFHIGQRIRNQDGQSPRQGSSSNMATPISGSNSMTLSRDTVSLPDREDGETAIQYLKRVEELSPRSQIASVLAQTTDTFHFAVMRSFMRTYAFFGDPLDMAVRKLLIEVVLPKETQQIDRLLQSFADRYLECNPGIFNSIGRPHKPASRIFF